MNIITYNFGDVRVVIDSKNERYVTWEDKEVRFSQYAMAEVNKLYFNGSTVEQAYKTVFKRLCGWSE